MALTMTSSPSVEIVGVDLSYRNTGIAWMRKEGSTLRDIGYESLKHPELKMGFDGLMESSSNMSRLVDSILSRTPESAVILVEVPSYSQNAKSAIVAGMCWMVAKEIEERRGLAIIIDPSILKTWSDSRRGDGKTIVKQEVLSRLPIRITDDNVIDAAGICLMFSDEISIQRHVH